MKKKSSSKVIQEPKIEVVQDVEMEDIKGKS